MAGILWWNFGWLYALVIAATIVLYVGFTYLATEWRINIRRVMNDADNDANTKAIDSLLNFETVKYFGNEEHEARRFDHSMARYEKRGDQDLDLARRSQCRPGGRLFARSGAHHGHVGASTSAPAARRSAISS